MKKLIIVTIFITNFILSCRTYKAANVQIKLMPEIYEDIDIFLKNGEILHFKKALYDDKKGIFSGISSKGEKIEVKSEEIEVLITYSTRTYGTWRAIGYTTLGIIGAATMGFGIFFASISCPYIFTFNGESYKIDAEPLSGAIVESLKRVDMIPLEFLKPFNDKYIIRQENRLDEKHFTDSVSLIVVDHRENVKALPSVNGKIVTIKSPEPPLEAINKDGKDILQLILKRDGKTYPKEININTELDNKPLLDSINLKFDVPEGKQRAKLILTGKTSSLGSFFFRRYLASLFLSPDFFLNMLNKLPNIKDSYNERMINEGAFIKVNVNNKNAGHFPEIGPGIIKEQVIEIELEKNLITVSISLEFGKGLWEIDSVALDFSENEDVIAMEIKPDSAFNEKGENKLLSLLKNDNFYYIAEKGNFLLITFNNVPPMKDSERSIILKHSGYYNIEKLPEKNKDRFGFLFNQPFLTEFGYKYLSRVINKNQRKIRMGE